MQLRYTVSSFRLLQSTWRMQWQEADEVRSVCSYRWKIVHSFKKKKYSNPKNIFEVRFYALLYLILEEFDKFQAVCQRGQVFMNAT